MLHLESVCDVILPVADHFWLPPHEMAAILEPRLRTIVPDLASLVISGHDSTLSFYMISQGEVLVFTPFACTSDNIVLQACAPTILRTAGEHCVSCARDERLDKRLLLPRVLLINPCVLENFPVPRLSLSVSTLATHLRSLQLADVRIADMQLELTKESIIRLARDYCPDVVGMSVSYGQRDIAIDLLSELDSIRTRLPHRVAFIVGNVIAASYPKDFLLRFGDTYVALGEGEPTISGFLQYWLGNLRIEEVPGLAYLSIDGEYRSTIIASLPPESIPFPALDTLADIARFRGALTLEISRGCQWNKCTFCPRHHKSATWKTMSPDRIVYQISRLAKAADHFGVKRHIFIADEEFVGGMADGAETERLVSLSSMLIANKAEISFDAAARADQVYCPGASRQWHVDRMHMWRLCRRAGLDRLFMGIESGSAAQLKRYGKGLQPDESVLAIRLLSALGIPLRFGFITFDQLMVGLDDLKENIAFLERTDAFLRPIDLDTISLDELFERVCYDDDFVRRHSQNIPLHAGVSYMLASMEVLIHSGYARMLKVYEARNPGSALIDWTEPDTNMGRYRVSYADPVVGDLSDYSQRWIDRNFAVAYTVKSLFKVANVEERRRLNQWMIEFRAISHMLLKGLVRLMTRENKNELTLELPPADAACIDRLQASFECGQLSRREAIRALLDVFEEKVASINQEIQSDVISRRLTDTVDERLRQALHQWDERRGAWELINDPHAATAT